MVETAPPQESNGQLQPVSERQAHEEITAAGNISSTRSKKPEEKMNIFQTALAVVATNAGGGILGTPYAFYHLGIVNAIILCLVIAIASQASVMIYLRTKDLTPRKYESVYEIAYLLNGRNAIFLVILTQTASALGCMILYYIILGDTTGNMFAQLFVSGSMGKDMQETRNLLVQEAWYARLLSLRAVNVLFIGVAAFLFIFKRRLEELKSISYVFLTVLGLFITLLITEQARDDGAKRLPFEEMASVKVDQHLLTAISILLFAYSFQFIVFPAYVELENRSNWRFEQASLWGLIIYTVAMISTGITGVLLFGASVKTDLLLNIGEKAGGLSIFIRIIYCFILMFHLPYIFFALKEYVLVMYEEIASSTLSTHLETKLQQHQQNEEERVQLLGADNEEQMNQNVGRAEDMVSQKTLSARSDKSELTYKSLPDKVRITITLILHLCILTLAIAIQDIETVFDFVGTVACACVTFVFPATGYLMALNRYGSEARRAKLKTKVFMTLSWTFLFLGILSICGYLTFLSLKLAGTFTSK